MLINLSLISTSNVETKTNIYNDKFDNSKRVVVSLGPFCLVQALYMKTLI